MQTQEGVEPGGGARRRSGRLRAVVAAGALISGALLGATGAPAAATSLCTGTSATWVGIGDGISWGDPMNWSLQKVPGAGDSATIPAGHGSSVSVEVSKQVSLCDLDVGAEVNLTIDGGAIVQASSVHVDGGPSFDAYTQIIGNLTALSVTIGDGYTGYASNDGLTENDITVNGILTVDGGAHFTLGDRTSNVRVNGHAFLGGSSTTYLNSNASADDDASAQLVVDGTVTLKGGVSSSALDLRAARSSTIALGGHTWRLAGDSFAIFQPLVQLTSSPGGGELAIGDEYHLLLNGATTVGPRAVLALSGSGTLGDGRWFTSSGAPGIVKGPGTFRWLGGNLVGHLTLDDGLTTLLNGAGDRDVANPPLGSTLVDNEGALTMTAGRLTVDSDRTRFVNRGRVKVSGGVVGVDSSITPPLLNDRGATWTVAPSVGRHGGISDGSFTNDGTLVINPLVRFTVDNVFRQLAHGTVRLTVSGPKAHSTLAATAMRLDGQLAAQSAAGYRPKPTVTVRGVITAQERAGHFADVQSVVHRAHTRWTVAYHGARVDAVLVRAR